MSDDLHKRCKDHLDRAKALIDRSGMNLARAKRLHYSAAAILLLSIFISAVNIIVSIRGCA